MEIVEDLLYALAGDNPGSLLLELSELFLQINVEKTELVGLRLLRQLLRRVVKSHDQLEEVIEEVSIVLNDTILVVFFSLVETINVETLINRLMGGW